jgi:hypothetical protein
MQLLGFATGQSTQTHMKSPIHPQTTRKGLLAAVALIASTALIQAIAPAISPVVESPAPSPFHALLKVDFSTNYLTPRGLNG